jgi:hypothetical protein
MTDAKTMFESLFQSPFAAFTAPVDAAQLDKMSTAIRRMQDAGVAQVRKACDDMMALSGAQLDYAMTLNRAWQDMTTDMVKRAAEARGPSATKAG